MRVLLGAFGGGVSWLGSAGVERGRGWILGGRIGRARSSWPFFAEELPGWLWCCWVVEMVNWWFRFKVRS